MIFLNAVTFIGWRVNDDIARKFTKLKDAGEKSNLLSASDYEKIAHD